MSPSNGGRSLKPSGPFRTIACITVSTVEGRCFMANFGKYANLSPKDWDEKTATQVIAMGQNAHVGLLGCGPAGEPLIVKAETPTICVTHEEPFNRNYANWRHFLITALQDGETKITARTPL